MIEFIKKEMPKGLDKLEEAKWLDERLALLEEELFDLEEYEPELNSNYEEELEKIDGKMHSIKLKIRYFKDALSEYLNDEVILNEITNIRNERNEKLKEVDLAKEALIASSEHKLDENSSIEETEDNLEETIETPVEEVEEETLDVQTEEVETEEVTEESAPLEETIETPVEEVAEETLDVQIEEETEEVAEESAPLEETIETPVEELTEETLEDQTEEVETEEVTEESAPLEETIETPVEEVAVGTLEDQPEEVKEETTETLVEEVEDKLSYEE